MIIGSSGSSLLSFFKDNNECIHHQERLLETWQGSRHQNFMSYFENHQPWDRPDPWYKSGCHSNFTRCGQSCWCSAVRQETGNSTTVSDDRSCSSLFEGICSRSAVFDKADEDKEEILFISQKIQPHFLKFFNKKFSKDFRIGPMRITRKSKIIYCIQYTVYSNKFMYNEYNAKTKTTRVRKVRAEGLTQKMMFWFFLFL